MAKKAKNELAEATTPAMTIIDKVDQFLASKDYDNFTVPLNEVIGGKFLENQESFGGKTLAENAVICQQTMDIASDLHEIWNHGHTQFAWKHINFSALDDVINMRQVSAELSNKASILNGAKWGIIETQVKIAELEWRLSQLDETKNEMHRFKKMKIIMSLAQMRESAEENKRMLEGTMKDMIALKDSYDQLNQRVSDISEYDVEKNQPYQHMVKSINQCIRDVRQYGMISKGEQEYAEQIGINPSKLLMAIKNYLEKEAISESWDTRELKIFVTSLAKELAENLKVSEIRSEMAGFRDEPIEGASSIKKVARLEKSEE